VVLRAGIVGGSRITKKDNKQGAPTRAASLKEFAFIAAVMQLIVGYSGRAIDRMLVVKAMTAPGLPLARFKARDFAANVDINSLIA
jgi:hypothetical protein